MKIILKDKLENALQKQKDELRSMLQQYIELITKLLQDKEELTTTIQKLIDENQKKTKQVENDYSLKLRSVIEEKDEQVASTKNQIEEFLSIIEQYEE
jgi:ABC-type transporter Mla subunit MlaD